MFFITSILICIPLAFYYQQANPFLVELGMENPTGKMTLGQISEVLFMLLLPFFFKKFGFKKTLLVEMNHTKDQVNIPKSYEAGSIGHTLSSIFERSNKIDTWGIIVLCFFIDFIVPFAMFLVLRKNDGQLKSVFSSKPETF